MAPENIEQPVATQEKSLASSDTTAQDFYKIQLVENNKDQAKKALRTTVDEEKNKLMAEIGKKNDQNKKEFDLEGIKPTELLPWDQQNIESVLKRLYENPKNKPIIDKMVTGVLESKHISLTGEAKTNFQDGVIAYLAQYLASNPINIVEILANPDLIKEFTKQLGSKIESFKSEAITKLTPLMVAIKKGKYALNLKGESVDVAECAEKSPKLAHILSSKEWVASYFNAENQLDISWEIINEYKSSDEEREKKKQELAKQTPPEVVQAVGTTDVGDLKKDPLSFFGKIMDIWKNNKGAGFMGKIALILTTLFPMLAGPLSPLLPTTPIVEPATEAVAPTSESTETEKQKKDIEEKEENEKYKKEIEDKWEKDPNPLKKLDKYKEVSLNITEVLIKEYKEWKLKHGNENNKLGTFLETREKELGIENLVPKWCEFLKDKKDGNKNEALDPIEHYDFLRLVKDKAGKNTDLSSIKFDDMYKAFKGNTKIFPVSGQNGFVGKCTEWLNKDENKIDITNLLTKGKLPEKK